MNAFKIYPGTKSIQEPRMSTQQFVQKQSHPDRKTNTVTMGSIALPSPKTKPWIETPLVESSALSKAAGW